MWWLGNYMSSGKAILGSVGGLKWGCAGEAESAGLSLVHEILGRYVNGRKVDNREISARKSECFSGRLGIYILICREYQNLRL